jgi:hypothetical protein
MEITVYKGRTGDTGRRTYNQSRMNSVLMNYFSTLLKEKGNSFKGINIEVEFVLYDGKNGGCS